MAVTEDLPSFLSDPPSQLPHPQTPVAAPNTSVTETNSAELFQRETALSLDLSASSEIDALFAGYSHSRSGSNLSATSASDHLFDSSVRNLERLLMQPSSESTSDQAQSLAHQQQSVAAQQNTAPPQQHFLPGNTTIASSSSATNSQQQQQQQHSELMQQQSPLMLQQQQLHLLSMQQLGQGGGGLQGLLMSDLNNHLLGAGGSGTGNSNSGNGANNFNGSGLRPLILDGFSSMNDLVSLQQSGLGLPGTPLHHHFSNFPGSGGGMMLHSGMGGLGGMHGGGMGLHHPHQQQNHIMHMHNMGNMNGLSGSSLLSGGGQGGSEYRIGAYTREERQMKIEAFRAKKRKRIWRKQIKYDCRKRLADTRPRFVIALRLIDGCTLNTFLTGCAE